MKRFAETIFADQGNPVSHAFYLRLFVVPDQSAKNAKIMRLENLVLYGIQCMYSFVCNLYTFVCTLDGVPHDGSVDEVVDPIHISVTVIFTLLGVIGIGFAVVCLFLNYCLREKL